MKDVIKKIMISIILLENNGGDETKLNIVIRYFSWGYSEKYFKVRFR